MTDIETILSWFQTGDIPTEEHFKQTFSSFRNKNTKIPIAEVDGLEASLNNKANVGDIPDNMALVDEGQPVDVFNKEQIMTMAMMLSDYVKDGKIRADKIEALGLTDLIEAKESTLDEFVSSSNNYDFQQNDFIAIPVDGNFSLFIFKGGDKKIIANYLPTGLTNINISMVEGLQDVLNRKLEKPTTDGNYFINMSGNPTYKTINPEENHLLFWDGANFKNSSIFRDNGGLKFGIGTNTPSEQLHLKDRARMKALVLEDNSETLPQQLTYNNKKFYGTDITGLKRKFMFSDYDDFVLLANSLTDAQKTAWKTIMNGNISISTMSVIKVTPFLIPRQDNNYYITLEGANLNINPLTSKVSICDLNNNVLLDIPNSQVQYYGSGLNLTFYYNFFTLGEGEYKIKIDNGFAILYVTQPIKITANINYLPLGDIKWNIKRYNDIISSDQYVNVQNSYYKVDNAVKTLASDGIPIFNTKINNKEFLSTDNFYIKFVASANVGANSSVTQIAKFGLTDILEANNIPDLLQDISFRGADGFAVRLYVGNVYVSTLNNGGSVSVEFIKQGTSLAIYIESSDVYQGGNVRYSALLGVATTNPLYFSALYYNNNNANAFGSVVVTAMYKF